MILTANQLFLSSKEKKLSRIEQGWEKYRVKEKKKTGEQGYNEIRTKAIKEIPRDIFKEDSMERRKI